MLPQQMSFGDFIKMRHGPKWVYAARATPQLRYRYPDSVVITPKQQRELARDYKAEWGREYDPEYWQMLCALRAIHAHAAARDNCPTIIEALAAGAIAAATT